MYSKKSKTALNYSHYSLKLIRKNVAFVCASTSVTVRLGSSTPRLRKCVVVVVQRQLAPHRVGRTSCAPARRSPSLRLLWAGSVMSSPVLSFEVRSRWSCMVSICLRAYSCTRGRGLTFTSHHVVARARYPPTQRTTPMRCPCSHARFTNVTTTTCASSPRDLAAGLFLTFWKVKVRREGWGLWVSRLSDKVLKPHIFNKFCFSEKGILRNCPQDASMSCLTVLCPLSHWMKMTPS